MDSVRVWRYASDAVSRPYPSEASNCVCLQMEARFSRKLYFKRSWPGIYSAGTDFCHVDSVGAPVTLHQDQEQHRIHLLRGFWDQYVHHICIWHHTEYSAATRGSNIPGWKRGNALRVFCQRCTPQRIARCSHHEFVYVGFDMYLVVLLYFCAACMPPHPGRALPHVHVGSRECQYGLKFCADTIFGNATRSFHCLASCWVQGGLTSSQLFSVTYQMRV
jgi:hypothetical protein